MPVRGTAVTRRAVVCALLFVALGVSGVGWAEAPVETRSGDRAVAVTPPPGLAVDAALKGRTDLLAGGWAELRVPKARVRLGLAVLVGLTVVLAAAVATLRRPSPAPRSTLWRRWSLSLRAPPALRFS
jgi:hypothetical protein